MKVEYNRFNDSYRFELDDEEPVVLTSNALDQIFEFAKEMKTRESIQDYLKQSEVIYGMDHEVIEQDADMMNRIADHLMQKQSENDQKFYQEIIQDSNIKTEALRKAIENPELTERLNERVLNTIKNGSTVNLERKDLMVQFNDSLYTFQPLSNVSGDVYIKCYTYLASGVEKRDSVFEFQISQEIGREPEFLVRELNQETMFVDEWKELSDVISNPKEINQIKEILVAYSDLALERDIPRIQTFGQAERSLMQKALMEIQIIQSKFNTFLEHQDRKPTYNDVLAFVKNEIDMYADADDHETETHYSIYFDYGIVAGWITSHGPDGPELNPYFNIYDPAKSQNGLEYVTKEQIAHYALDHTLENEELTKETQSVIEENRLSEARLFNLDDHSIWTISELEKVYNTEKVNKDFAYEDFDEWLAIERLSNDCIFFETFLEENWNDIVSFMDPNHYETIHAALSPCSKNDLITGYLNTYRDIDIDLEREFCLDVNQIRTEEPILNAEKSYKNHDDR